MPEAGGNAFRFCEANHMDEAIRQPSNTWSNLGYLIVGLFTITLAVHDYKNKNHEKPNYKRNNNKIEIDNFKFMIDINIKEYNMNNLDAKILTKLHFLNNLTWEEIKEFVDLMKFENKSNFYNYFESINIKNLKEFYIGNKLITSEFQSKLYEWWELIKVRFIDWNELFNIKNEDCYEFDELKKKINEYLILVPNEILIQKVSNEIYNYMRENIDNKFPSYPISYYKNLNLKKMENIFYLSLEELEHLLNLKNLY